MSKIVFTERENFFPRNFPQQDIFIKKYLNYNLKYIKK